MNATTRLEESIARERLLRLAPVIAALCYPFLLRAFHETASWDGPAWRQVAAASILLVAFAVPALGIWAARALCRAPVQTVAHWRGRQAAFLCVCSPPLFVFAGVLVGLLETPVSDIAIWLVLWAGVGAYVWPMKQDVRAEAHGSSGATRVAHGISALLIVLFVSFHLANHLSGWVGPQLHRTVMQLGRLVYRSELGEPILLILLLFQIASGAWLVYWWSAKRADGYRVFQIASGDYLAVFILTHLNSALISARMVRGVETDWAWATGAPTGLLLDAWNIRLLPHYAFGVFFVLAHLASGLRVVLLGHGVDLRVADRCWRYGVIASALVALAIALALCGARVPATMFR